MLKLIKKYRQKLLVQRLLVVLGIDVFVKISGIILLPVYLRLMTQEEYGLYGYLLSIILIFSAVLNFGLYIPLSKFYHDFTNHRDKGRLLFMIFLILGILLGCIIIPFYSLGLDYSLVKVLFKNAIDYKYYRGIVLLAVIVSVCNFMLTNFFFMSEKINQAKKYNISRIILINLVSLGFLFYFQNIDAVYVRLQATYIVELLLLLLFGYYVITEMTLAFDRKLAWRSLKMALPIMSSAAFGIIINFSDKFFLEKYSSFADFSNYYLAFAFAGIIPMIFASLQNAWLPLFFKEKDIEKNVANTTKLFQRLAVFFVILALSMLLFLKLMLLFGIISTRYEQALNVLPLILASQVLAALVPLYSNFIVYFEKTHVAFVTGFFIAIINIGLSLLLIPRYGMYGAAMVVLLSNTIYLVIYYLIIKNYIKKHLQIKYATPQ